MQHRNKNYTKVPWGFPLKISPTFSGMPPGVFSEISPKLPPEVPSEIPLGVYWEIPPEVPSGVSFLEIPQGDLLEIYAGVLLRFFPGVSSKTPREFPQVLFRQLFLQLNQDFPEIFAPGVFWE